MSIKELLSKPFAYLVKRKMNKWINNPLATQEKVFHSLLNQAKNTDFGQDHQFSTISNYEDFVQNVPVRDYEGLKPYVEKIIEGGSDILWPGKPKYFAKTSGTTSGTKYIPLTDVSIKEQINASRNAILNYISETGKSKFVNGKMIFLQGSPEMDDLNGIKVGRLSGISAHYVPNYLQRNRMPSWETNCIEDWEEKVNAIVDETINEPMSIISGIPSWVQMYFEKLIERTDKPVGEIFKSFDLFIYGGVNFEPYTAKFQKLIGRPVDSIELYPASEGFFAFQDTRENNGMLLLLNSGIFYEFIEADSFFEDNPKRITLKDVEIGVNYVMIISTNAGLWAYNLGDTVSFTSLKPYRILVTGRIKHFISAFGEHVIGKEVEQAIKKGIENSEAIVTEFTVAPQVKPSEGELPYHEWFIEFEKEPKDMSSFIGDLDQSLQEQNSYYFDLIKGSILQPLKIQNVKAGGFKYYMKSIGKLGGQNKVPRLANDRKIAEKLIELDLTI
ncbi:MAG: GH3 auxin-responsive promoter family protein [bacterium]